MTIYLLHVERLPWSILFILSPDTPSPDPPGVGILSVRGPSQDHSGVCILTYFVVICPVASGCGFLSHQGEGGTVLSVSHGEGDSMEGHSKLYHHGRDNRGLWRPLKPEQSIWWELCSSYSLKYLKYVPLNLSQHSTFQRWYYRYIAMMLRIPFQLSVSVLFMSVCPTWLWESI